VSLRVVSYGGGTQSTALLVLAAQREIDFPVFLFANVGDDSEDPATLAYLAQHAVPFAAAHGIDLHVLDKVKRDGTIETLWGRLMKDGSRSLPIPVRMSNGAPGKRSCTTDFKIRVIRKWLKQHGATTRDKATVAIGFSADEMERVGARRPHDVEEIVYPLLDLGLRREACQRIIERAGLPLPPKSACFFCPFHRPKVFADMRRDRVALFDKAVLLERTLNARRDVLGKDHVYLTRFARPLDDAVLTAQPNLFDTGGPGETSCDDGYCWT